MRSLVLSGLLLATVATPAAADPLSRIAAANEAMAARMEVFFVSRVPELADKMPDYGWDAEMRAAGACFVDGYRAERGDAGLEDYVTAMEAWAEVEITSFQQMSFGMPGILTEPLPLSLSQDCGVIDISIRRAQEAGFTQAMSDPAVMEKLLAD